jgi:hypothetical protein
MPSSNKLSIIILALFGIVIGLIWTTGLANKKLQ